MIGVETLTVGIFGSNSYLVSCPETREAVVLDPGAEGGKIAERIRDLGLKVTAIVNTHGHIDHVLANLHIKNATGASLIMHPEEVPLYRKPGFILSFFTRKLPSPDREIKEGDKVNFGKCRAEVLHTPGHTPGGITLYICGCLFTGDTLFAGSVGRTDMWGGSMNRLLESINKKIVPLPEDTVVYPGHGPPTTVGEEKKQNPFIKNAIPQG